MSGPIGGTAVTPKREIGRTTWSWTCRARRSASVHARMGVMRLPTLRRTRPAEPGVIAGLVRLDRRTKRLVGRLRPGDIAVIDHVDLDRVAADSLAAAGVAAVLNAKPSVSGRYPNLGPEGLIKAGSPLVADLGDELFERLH